ncbi:MAG TPA: ABC transporter ATP-binding protein [Phycisphaerales bacterium]|nr:ABC transporter ATP-binding protein [Phycisphaerales bacterium]
MTSVLQARAVWKTYQREDAPDVEALRGVDLEVAAGEFVAVTGPSGCGKSTLLTVLSGLDMPTSGSVVIAGRDVTSSSEQELAELRNKEIGFVFQSFHLVSSMTALENVAFPAELAGEQEAISRAERLLDQVGLSDRAHSFPHQLSGGEKQRVALCRALINQAKLIFADEPTGNLDSHNGDQVLELLIALQKEQGSSLVLVSHSSDVVARADRVVRMKDGKVVAD